MPHLALKLDARQQASQRVGGVAKRPAASRRSQQGRCWHQVEQLLAPVRGASHLACNACQQ